jgi:MFS family permease
VGNEAAGPRSNKYVVLAIVLVGVLMSVLDGSVVNIALPTISAAFGEDVALSQWTITAYLVTMTALLLFFGRVSDFTGKAALFTAGQALFTLGSLA